MDMHLRYFNEETQMVETQYLDSPYIKRPSSDNLHQELLNPLSVTGVKRLIQISMDDPNVHWDVLKKHFQHRKGGDISSLILIGSCGLHIVHGASQTDMTESCWNLHKVLNTMWKIAREI